MNKMNIPPPFRMALPTPPLPPEVPAPPPPLPPPSVTVKPRSADLSSDESEMESSDEVTSSPLPMDQTTHFLYNSIQSTHHINLSELVQNIRFVFHPVAYLISLQTMLTLHLPVVVQCEKNLMDT